MLHRYKQLNKPSSRLIPLSKKLIRLSCITLLLTIASLSIVSLIAYLSPLRGATRPCLPFSLSRLSSSAHRKLSCGATNTLPGLDTMTIANGESANGAAVGNRLGDFLLSQREAFLGDIQGGSLKGWTVVMGNEAGGLSCLPNAPPAKLNKQIWTRSHRPSPTRTSPPPSSPIAPSH